MLKGIDVSNWQAGLIPSSLDIDFCIAKATEGIGYTDRTCDGFVQNCIDNGIPFGFYHFARENDPKSEADYFVQETRNYFGHGIPVLDYETENFNNCVWCEQFMVRVHELTGVWPVLYISASRCSQYSGSWLPETCGLWVAGYPAAFNSWYEGEMPYDIFPWSFCAMWQFTSSLQLAGYAGNLDGNIAYMDREAWMKYANPDGSSVQPAQPEQPEKSDDDLACEVILGEYGTGEDRKRALGSRYDAVQARVNAYYDRARECIRGDWGNGWNRQVALNGAGYNAEIVQRLVNDMMN